MDVFHIVFLRIWGMRGTSSNGLNKGKRLGAMGWIEISSDEDTEETLFSTYQFFSYFAMTEILSRSRSSSFRLTSSLICTVKGNFKVVSWHHFLMCSCLISFCVVQFLIVWFHRSDLRPEEVLIQMEWGVWLCLRLYLAFNMRNIFKKTNMGLGLGVFLC